MTEPKQPHFSKLTEALQKLGEGLNKVGLDDLIKFLSARLDEDEQVAQFASDDFGAPCWVMPEQRRDTPFSTIHLQRHPPARVLLEIVAKRQMIEWVLAQQVPNSTIGDDFVFPLYAMASAYAQHPDYRQEWAP